MSRKDPYPFYLAAHLSVNIEEVLTQEDLLEFADDEADVQRRLAAMAQGASDARNGCLRSRVHLQAALDALLAEVKANDP